MASKHPTWRNNPEITRGRAQPAVQDDIIYLLDHGWSLDEISQASGVCVRQLRYVLSGIKRVRTGTAMLLQQARQKAETTASVLSLLED